MPSTIGTLLAVLVLGLVVPTVALSCKSEAGKSVDWWVIMKAPYLPESSDPSAASGYGYAYADASSHTLRWTGRRLDQNLKGALGATLATIYNADTDLVGWLMYNDEPPKGKASDSYGHTKGDVAFDKSGGFWLVHSVPRFPVATGGASYTYPANEKEYGQSFLCISFDLDTFDDIGEAFLLNKPFVYDSNLPSSLASQVPSMRDVLNKNWDSRTALSNDTQVQSAGGKTFEIFSKNTKWDSNLYSDLIEPAINQGLYVESWMNGEDSNKMPTFCKGSKYAYSTINVRQVSIGDISWPETKDHSKWAVSLSSRAPVSCIGDINRQFSQAKRGGGSVCVNDATLYKSMSGMVTNADKCS